MHDSVMERYRSHPFVCVLAIDGGGGEIEW